MWDDYSHLLSKQELVSLLGPISQVQNPFLSSSRSQTMAKGPGQKLDWELLSAYLPLTQALAFG